MFFRATDHQGCRWPHRRVMALQWWTSVRKAFAILSVGCLIWPRWNNTHFVAAFKKVKCAVSHVFCQHLMSRKCLPENELFHIRHTACTYMWTFRYVPKGQRCYVKQWGRKAQVTSSTWTVALCLRAVLNILLLKSLSVRFSGSHMQNAFRCSDSHGQTHHLHQHLIFWIY